MMVSVVIPTRNRAALLRQALESVIAQEPSTVSVEIIVVDDGSTDETAAVVAAYPGVQYLPTRQGTAAGSRNIGIAAARGEWVAFLDDDDVWLPHKLRTCVELIDAHPEARLVYSAATICDADLRPGDTWYGPDLSDGRSAFDAFLDKVMTPSVVLLHRTVFTQVGLFDPTVPRVEDLDLWLRTTAAGLPVVGTHASLVLYRTRAGAEGAVDYATFRMTMRVLHRFLDSPTSPPVSLQRRREALRRTCGWYTWRMIKAARQADYDGQPEQAHYFRRAALSISPLHALRYIVVDLVGALRGVGTKLDFGQLEEERRDNHRDHS